MVTTRRRIANLVIGILFILSLLASSVSACTCSSHEHAAAQIETGSHHHHHEDVDHHDDSAETSAPFTDFINGSECFCSSPAPKVTSKSEAVRLEGKAVAAGTSISSFEPVAILLSEAALISFNPRAFLSDPLYGASPGRAPPRL